MACVATSPREIAHREQLSSGTRLRLRALVAATASLSALGGLAAHAGHGAYSSADGALRHDDRRITGRRLQGRCAMLDYDRGDTPRPAGRSICRCCPAGRVRDLRIDARDRCSLPGETQAVCSHYEPFWAAGPRRGPESPNGMDCAPSRGTRSELGSISLENFR